MTNRRTLLHAGLATLFCAVLPAAVQSAPPNFLIFVADDMAWNDCGAYGHPHIETPTLDRLALEGMRFDNAFLTCSSCSPSRCSVLTGRYPHATGAEELHTPLPPDQTTFIDVLREGGYHTAATGKWHLGQDALRRFDTVNQGFGKWMETLRDRPKDKPFCLWMAFTDPHRPYQEDTIDVPHTAKDVIVPPFLPDVPAVRDDLAMYYDEISRMDGVIGETLELLEQQGATENTFVLFFSDNGRPFPRCKTTLYDSGIKTPFIVRWPTKVKPGSVSGSLVSTVDIAPTVIELAGLEVTDSFQGRSFAPILSTPTASTRDYIFADHDWHDFDDHQRAARDLRYKFIRNAYTDIPLTPPADAVRSPTYAAMQTLYAAGDLTPVQARIFAAPRPEVELYDLQQDPFELDNVADDPDYAEVRDRMTRAVDDYLERTGGDLPTEPRRPDGFDRETGERLEPRKR